MKDKYIVILFVFIIIFSSLIGLISTGSLDKVTENFRTFLDTKQSTDSYESYRDALKEQNFEAAHDTLNSYREDYLSWLSEDGYLASRKRVAAQGKYYQAFDEIYKSEIQYILSEFQGDECKDKILFLLEEIPVEGEKMPKGLCDFSVAWGDAGRPLDAYIIWTEHYNRLCNSILSLAINRKNQELAKLIILQFVDNVELTLGEENRKVDGIIVDSHHGYIKYTSEDRDAAKKKYDDAVRSGAFNE